jgi:hypothetical protein
MPIQDIYRKPMRREIELLFGASQIRENVVFAKNNPLVDSYYPLDKHDNVMSNIYKTTIYKLTWYGPISLLVVFHEG